MGKSVTDIFVDTFYGNRSRGRLYLHNIEHKVRFYTIANEATCNIFRLRCTNLPNTTKAGVLLETQKTLDADRTRIGFFMKMKCGVYIDPCSFQAAYRYSFNFSSDSCELIKWTNGKDTLFINRNYIFDRNLDKIAELHFNDAVMIVDKKCIGSTNAIHKTIVNNVIPAFISVYNGEVLFKDMQKAPRHLYKYTDNKRLGEMLNEKLKYLSNTSYF